MGNSLEGLKKRGLLGVSNSVVNTLRFRVADFSCTIDSLNSKEQYNFI